MVILITTPEYWYEFVHSDLIFCYIILFGPVSVNAEDFSAYYCYTNTREAREEVIH